MTDPGFVKAGQIYYNGAHGSASWNRCAWEPGRSDPLVGITETPLNLKAPFSFYTKEGSKVKDTFYVIARSRVQGRLLLAAMA